MARSCAATSSAERVATCMGVRRSRERSRMRLFRALAASAMLFTEEECDRVEEESESELRLGLMPSRLRRPLTRVGGA